MKLTPVNVRLKERSYDIYFDDDWKLIVKNIDTYQTLIITDENVEPLYLEKWIDIFPSADSYIIKSGEDSKSPEVYFSIQTNLIEKGFSRDTLIVALGGGVVGDLAGFVAATFMRGVKFLQIPTTLLSMVDASIGGKTGIDHPLGKNLIGAFYQPEAVLIDFEHLKSLPEREWLCGLGEVIKYGLISEPQIFNHIAQVAASGENPREWISPEIVRSCAAIKADIVANDEIDNSGLRIILNFGHTIGHAVEAALDYDEIKHGEAVVAGMAGAVYLSKEIDLIDEKIYNNIIDTLGKFPLPEIRSKLTPGNLIEYIFYDKKKRGGNLNFVLLQDIGKTTIISNIDSNTLNSALDFTIKFMSEI